MHIHQHEVVLEPYLMGLLRQKFEKHWRIQAVHVKTGQLLWEQIFGRLMHDF